MVRVSILLRRMSVVGVLVLTVSGVWLGVGASVSAGAPVEVQSVVPVAGNRTLVDTRGALTPLRPHDYTSMTFLGGGPAMRWLRLLFNSSLLQLLCPMALYVPVKNLSFRVSYSRIPLLPRERIRYGCMTILVNGSGLGFVRNKIHTLEVHGFTGVFEFTRAKMLRSFAARFEFIGIADSVSLQIG